MPRLHRFLAATPLDADLGRLVVRLGVGLSMLIFHGWGKITAGPELWTKVGGAMGNLGIHFLPTMWGFLAAASESVASLLLVLGLLFRPAAAMLAFTMLVATLQHLSMPPDAPNAGWKGASHALELFSVYAGLLLAGAGRYALLGGGGAARQ